MLLCVTPGCLRCIHSAAETPDVLNCPSGQQWPGYVASANVA